MVPWQLGVHAGLLFRLFRLTKAAEERKTKKGRGRARTRQAQAPNSGMFSTQATLEAALERSAG